MKLLTDDLAFKAETIEIQRVGGLQQHDRSQLVFQKGEHAIAKGFAGKSRPRVERDG